MSERILDCGHPPSPHGEHTTGTAHTPEGKEICWTCSHARELEMLKTADRFTAYLTKRADGAWILSTWPGQELARVHSCAKRRVGFGGERFYWRATDVHGSEWYGTSPGFGMYARMRRAKH